MLDCSTIAANVYSQPFFQIESHVAQSGAFFRELFHKVQEACTQGCNQVRYWPDHAIQQLDEWNHRLDVLIPNFPIQTRIDQVVGEIEATFAPLTVFNDWLNSNGNGAWYEQLAQFVVKLPVRAARNIVQMLYNIIKTAVYTAVHPLKSLTELAKLLINLVQELAKPESWTKMGAGIAGSALGQALVTGNVYALIGVGIGGALVLGGLSAGALKTALENESDQKLDATLAYLSSQALELPEALLTGFYLGLILGGIQRAIQGPAATCDNTLIAKQNADQFIKEHNLPRYSSAEVNAQGHTVIRWESRHAWLTQNDLQFRYPSLFKPVFHDKTGPVRLLLAEIELAPHANPGITVHYPAERYTIPLEKFDAINAARQELQPLQPIPAKPNVRFHFWGGR